MYLEIWDLLTFMYVWICSDEMDTALMQFVNALGVVIMVGLVGFHYLTSSVKDAEE